MALCHLPDRQILLHSSATVRFPQGPSGSIWKDGGVSQTNLTEQPWAILEPLLLRTQREAIPTRTIAPC